MDKIALKIYPFGIDYPIVSKESLTEQPDRRSCGSRNPAKDMDSVSSTE